MNANAELSFTQPIQMRFNELLGGSVTDVAISIYGDDLAELAGLAAHTAEAVRPGARRRRHPGHCAAGGVAPRGRGRVRLTPPGPASR